MRILPARQYRSKDVVTVFIDSDLWSELSRFSWQVSKHGYVFRRVYAGKRANGTSRQRDLYLHRHILGLTKGDGKTGDHINRDPLDNRRENLRVVTQAGNAQNNSGHARTRAGEVRTLPRGVSWSRQRRKYVAQAGLNGEVHNLGFFLTVEEANAVVVAWRQEHMPYSTETPAPLPSAQNTLDFAA